MGIRQCCYYLDSPSLLITDCIDHHRGLLTWWYSHSQIHAVSLQRSSGTGYHRKTQPVFLNNWIIAVKRTRDLLSINNSTICTPKRTRSGKITRCSVLEYSDDSNREMTTSLLKRSTQIEWSVSLFWINTSLFVSKIGIKSSPNYELSDMWWTRNLQEGMHWVLPYRRALLSERVSLRRREQEEELTQRQAIQREDHQ